MSLLDPVDEKKLMEEAAKQLRPVLDEAIARLRSIVVDVLEETEVVITFRKKES